MDMNEIAQICLIVASAATCTVIGCEWLGRRIHRAAAEYRERAVRR
jgi:hypothetical protein